MENNKSLIDDSLRVTNAHAFQSNIGDAFGQSTLYLSIGKTQPWSEFENDAGFEPPMPEPTREYKAEFWRDIVGIQKIDAFDVRHVIRRKDWGNPIIPGSLTFQVGDVVVVNTINNVNRHPQHPSGIQVYQCVQVPTSGQCSIDPENITNEGDCYAIGGEWTPAPSPGLVNNIPRTRESGFDTLDGYLWDYLYSIPLDVEASYVNDEWIVVPNQDEVESERNRWGLTDEVVFGDNRLIYRTDSYYLQIIARVSGTTFSEIGLTGQAFRQIAIIANPLLKVDSTVTPVQKAVAESVRIDSLLPDSGDILYMENRLPTNRDLDQTEEIVITIQF